MPAVLSRVSPSGRLVLFVRVHTTAEAESVASTAVYALPATPSGNEAVVIAMLGPTLMQPSSLGTPCALLPIPCSAVL